MMAAAHEIWKYRAIKVDNYPYLVPLDTLEAQMNALGKEGYELCEVIRGTSCNILLFKQIVYPEVKLETARVPEEDDIPIFIRTSDRGSFIEDAREGKI